MTFEDREDAGRQLGQALLDYRDQDVVVLELPRGDVPVGVPGGQVAGAPLDVVVTTLSNPDLRANRRALPGRKPLGRSHRKALTHTPTAPTGACAPPS